MPRFQCYRTDDSRVRWRLLGGNNRVLGVGLAPHPNHQVALAEIALVRCIAATAIVEVDHALSGLWWWRMRRGDAFVARSAQGFARRVDATLAVGRFRTRAPGAAIDPVLAQFLTGRRGRTSRNHVDQPMEHRTITIPDPRFPARRRRRPGGSVPAGDETP